MQDPVRSSNLLNLFINPLSPLSGTIQHVIWGLNLPKAFLIPPTSQKWACICSLGFSPAQALPVVLKTQDTLHARTPCPTNPARRIPLATSFAPSFAPLLTLMPMTLLAA